MRSFRVGFVVAAALLGILLSCGKDEQETQKFERADNETFVRDMSDLSSFTLSNGITVYLQEERTDNQVAVEVLYGGAFLNDPPGKPQLAHVTEHLALHCASGNYKAEETLGLIADNHGMISAEAVSDFSHIDYIVPSENLETVFQVESTRLQSLECDEAVRAQELAKVKSELNKTLNNPKYSLIKYGMMSLNQILFYDKKFVPVDGIIDRISVADVENFHKLYYRPDDLVLVVIGDMKKPETEAMIRKYFEGIPRRPLAEKPRVPITQNVRATWDIAAECVFFVSPGPYANFKDRLILTMLGTYLHQLMMNSEPIYTNCGSVYATNQVYRVDVLPFFIFAQPAVGRTNSDVAPLLLQALSSAMASIDASRLEAIKGGMISFQRSTMLKPDVSDYPLAHFKVIGQEALNVGMTSMLREGRSVDEFCDEINSITLDEVKAVIARYLDQSRLIEVTLTQRK